MHAIAIAVVNKHHIAGIVAIVLGALAVILGGFRVVGGMAKATLIPLIGVAVVVLGVLTYLKVI